MRYSMAWHVLGNRFNIQSPIVGATTLPALKHSALGSHPNTCHDGCGFWPAKKLGIVSSPGIQLYMQEKRYNFPYHRETILLVELLNHLPSAFECLRISRSTSPLPSLQVICSSHNPFQAADFGWLVKVPN